MADPIFFYFDFGSPYGYLASKRIDALAARHGREVRWRAFLVGAAVKLTGIQSIFEQPMRGPYTVHDMQRFARLQGLPLKVPPVLPMHSLAASRAYYWLFDQDPALAKSFAIAVFEAEWAEGRDLSSIKVVAEAATPLGIDAEALLAAVQDPAVKGPPPRRGRSGHRERRFRLAFFPDRRRRLLGGRSDRSGRPLA